MCGMQHGTELREDGENGDDRECECRIKFGGCNSLRAFDSNLVRLQLASTLDNYLPIPRRYLVSIGVVPGRMVPKTREGLAVGKQFEVGR